MIPASRTILPLAHLERLVRDRATSIADYGTDVDGSSSKPRPLDLPQALAALQFSRNTPGVWFLNPQEWVADHLFKAASIWEIPLVKPRFTCSVGPAAHKKDADIAGILQRSLEYFSKGGTCENGVIAEEP